MRKVQDQEKRERPLRTLWDRKGDEKLMRSVNDGLMNERHISLRINECTTYD